MYFSGPPGDPKNNSIYAFSKDLFPNLLQVYHVHFGIQLSSELCAETCPRIWHLISPRKGHVAAQWLVQSSLSQGQSQAVCPLNALKVLFCLKCQLDFGGDSAKLKKTTALGIGQLISMT